METEVSTTIADIEISKKDIEKDIIKPEDLKKYHVTKPQIVVEHAAETTESMKQLESSLIWMVAGIGICALVLVMIVGSNVGDRIKNIIFGDKEDVSSRD